jgi:methyl-accepting chemotaxis protein PixJ
LPDLGWFVLVETELEEALRAQQDLRQVFVLGTLVSLVVLGVVARILVSQGVRPIEAAAAAVEQFGQGDLTVRLAVKGNDEVAILGNNVNQMANQIQMLLQTVRQNAQQLSQQNDVLSTLARNEALIQGDALTTAQAFTEAIAQTLSVEHVSIWVYGSEHQDLTCLDQYDRSQNQHSAGEVLLMATVPEYFQGFSSVIATDDIQRHPALRWLVTSESLLPDTQAILNVPIQNAGQTTGVIRCDHTKTRRTWQAEEQTFVTSVANLMSIALESEFLQKEVGHLLDVVSEVEEGDLTTQAKVSDRSTGLVADTFNRLIERLTIVLKQVVDATEQVSTGTNQQKEMAEIVAINTKEQAQAVNQVLHLTEQVERMAEGSAEEAKATTLSLQAMRSTVEQGQGAIATLTSGIEVLQEGTRRIIQQMKTLGEFVGLADQFVQDQSQIASLTQTLALNASLVAARASEQQDPRQFAVVAREFDAIANQVARLAQQTNDGLITLEQRSSQIHSVVSIIDANIQNLGGLVRGFTQGVDQSRSVFGNVQHVTGAAVDTGAAVAQSSQTIVHAAQSAAQMVRDIAAIATQTAELSQHSQNQSEAMNNLSLQLQQSIKFFRLPDVANDGTRVDLSQAAETTVHMVSNPNSGSAESFSLSARNSLLSD